MFAPYNILVKLILLTIPHWDEVLWQLLLWYYTPHPPPSTCAARQVDEHGCSLAAAADCQLLGIRGCEIAGELCQGLENDDGWWWLESVALNSMLVCLLVWLKEKAADSSPVSLMGLSQASTNGLSLLNKCQSENLETEVFRLRWLLCSFAEGKKTGRGMVPKKKRTREWIWLW